LILKLHSVKIGGSLARNAHFDAPTCIVSSLWFSCGLAVSIGEAAKPLLVEGFQAGCNVVLRGRRATSWHSHASAKSVESRVFVAGAVQYFCVVFKSLVAFIVAGAALWRHPLSFCVAGTALETSRHFTLYTLLYTQHFSLYTLHSTLHTLRFTLHTLHFTLYSFHTPHSTLFTPHSTLQTPHFTLHTLHSTLYIPHFTLYTLHSTLHTLHFTLHTPHFALHPLPHSTVYSALVR